MEVMKMSIKGIHHVQVCIPAGAEDEARRFYTEVLGLNEIEKPEALKKNGGLWYKAGIQELHIGVEDQPVKGKHHPAFLVDQLEVLEEKLINNGIAINRETPIPGFNRFSVRDPFGNRLEFIEENMIG
jgi:catechol 2,3-dioxygenase-like lactoylglutathione lyase family enzyme